MLTGEILLKPYYFRNLSEIVRLIPESLLLYLTVVSVVVFQWALYKFIKASYVPYYKQNKRG